MEEYVAGTRIDHDRYGEGIISKVNLTNYDIFFASRGKVEISKRSEELTVIEAPETTSVGKGLTLPQIDEAISFVLDRFGALQEVVPLGDKWEGGKLIMQPANTALQSKEIPIEAFFHKIVMLRDRLRVLEQNINSHKSLTDEEKVHLQQYITRAYGSLTTFNVLFSEKDHYFKGAGK